MLILSDHFCGVILLKFEMPNKFISKLSCSKLILNKHLLLVLKFGLAV